MARWQSSDQSPLANNLILPAFRSCAKNCDLFGLCLIYLQIGRQEAGLLLEAVRHVQGERVTL